MRWYLRQCAGDRRHLQLQGDAKQERQRAGAEPELHRHVRVGLHYRPDAHRHGGVSGGRVGRHRLSVLAQRRASVESVDGVDHQHPGDHPGALRRGGTSTAIPQHQRCYQAARDVRRHGERVDRRAGLQLRADVDDVSRA